MTLGNRTELCREHRSAVDQFLSVARGLPADRWNTPLGDGKWSPAQVAEHIRLSYQVLTGELDGRPGLRLRTNWWQRTVARSLFLGRILNQGQIPTGARAPSEAKPGPGPFDRDQTLNATEALAAAFETKVSQRWDEKGLVVTHHIFGKLKPPQLVRFVVVHNQHHAAQLAG